MVKTFLQMPTMPYVGKKIIFVIGYKFDYQNDKYFEPAFESVVNSMKNVDFYKVNYYNTRFELAKNLTKMKPKNKPW